jgi:hypothetical protein
MSSTETVQGWGKDRITCQGARSVPEGVLGGSGRSAFPLVLYGPAVRFGRYEETPKLLVLDGDRVLCEAASSARN